MHLWNACRRLVPSSIRRRLGQWQQALLAVFAVCPVWLARCAPREMVRVFYGHRRIPRLDDRTYGGIVKFQYLQRDFPNSPRRFNVLYLVSSRLPAGAVGMARIARRRQVPIVWNQNGVAYPAWHGPGWERVNAPFAELLQMADHVFYQSHFCKLSADRYVGERDGPWEILFNPVDTRTFTPATADPDPDSLVLLLGGTQYQRYRVEVAFQVFAHVRRRYPNARLLVTGRCCWIPDEAQALRLARELAVEAGVERHVTFLGPYTQAEAPAVFRQAHVLVHTKYNDPCPTVVIEAMACGLPVVYSSSGGVEELVGEAGVGVPTELNWERDIPPDPAAMAEAFFQVAEQRVAMGQAARQRAVERFDLKPWLARHRQLFEQVVA